MPRAKNLLEVISALPLTTAEKQAAVLKAETVFDLKEAGAACRFTIAPQIYGGLIFKTEERILDLSLKNKLDEIRCKLR